MNMDSTTDECDIRPIDANNFECLILIDRSDEFAEGAQYVLEMIDNAPTLEIESTKYGHWISHGKNSPFTCSCCGSGCLLNYESDWHESDFCPHCGCRMRKEDD